LKVLSPGMRLLRCSRVGEIGERPPAVAQGKTARADQAAARLDPLGQFHSSGAH
jgi:hypothetical protein